ncbi:MAG TPA: flagellin [Bryobacteraceae bacterium]|jgi:flagellin|nr:flagellin [Bryobacteraceae bacterium]
MSFTINTNVASLTAQYYLQQTSNFQTQTINRVTSGLRIVQSGNDAAGLAVANGYRSNEAVLTQGIQNATNGLGQLQIVDGGMSNISQLLDQARTLATESASGTFTGDRTVLNQQFQGIIQEIDRQAQAIGLNTGGELAKNLSVFIGGGTSSNGIDSVQNGSVSVNLANATVDAKSLGLKGVEAIGTAGTDIGNGSANTSVSSILSNAINTASEAQAGYTQFTFSGPGFASGANSAPVTINVNLSGVTDANSLVTAINSAIQAASTQGTPQATAFQNANITAALNVDSSGKTQLTFSSSNAAFQVQGSDLVSNALMGNFATPDGSSPVGEGAAVTGATAVKANGGVAEAGITLTVAGTTTSAFTIAANATTAQVVADVNAALQATAGLTNYTASMNSSGNLVISGPNFSSFAATAAGDTSNLLGLSASTVNTLTNVFNSNGANESAAASNNDVYSFSALTATTTQTVSISSLDASGNAHAINVNLNASNAATLSAAVSTINSALQQSNDTTLQSLVVVQEQNAAGTAAGVRFLSSQATFKVSLGATAGTEGLFDNSTGVATQGTVTSSQLLGTGSTASIANLASAQAAVTALGNSVTILGRSQAAVGQGQNEFNYASNLAQSQLTNFAAAESGIRDANLAQESANLTKAQIQLQAGVAALAQANSAPQALLTLLSGH